jgi:hypothetical protein
MGWLSKLLRRVAGDHPDPVWRPTGIKPMERTWRIDKDHDDPRARKQLMAEVKARRKQAEQRGEKSNVVEIRKRA